VFLREMESKPLRTSLAAGIESSRARVSNNSLRPGRSSHVASATASQSSSFQLLSPPGSALPSQMNPMSPVGLGSVPLDNHSRSKPVSRGSGGRQSLKNVVPVVAWADTEKQNQTCKDKVKKWCRALVENVRFNIVTTMLTIYALFGDDFRLAATQAFMDPVFDVLTIICLITFSVEIVAASIGKDDYFLGFFFWLDFLSTGTLVCDLTWVGNAISCADAEGGSAVRAGRAARVARTVRIIRLIRLVKLYKSYRARIEEKEEKKNAKRISRRSMRKSVEPGETPMDDDEQYDEQYMGDAPPGAFDGPAGAKNAEQAETRVGKKLGDMTTRRVIILVLVMLICIPLFVPSAHGFEDFRTSVEFAQEFLYERFRQYCGTTDPWCLQSNVVSGSYTSSSQEAWKRSVWEDFLVQFIYSHQGGSFAYRLYWLGLSSKILTDQLGDQAAGDFLGNFAYLNQQRYLGSNAMPVSDWDGKYANPNWQTEVKPLPAQAQQRIISQWGEKCVKSFWGTPLDDILGDYAAGSCSIDDLRCTEVAYFMPLDRSDAEADMFNFLFAFNTRAETTLEAWLSMAQTVFICFCVGIGAMTFSNDANQLLLKPIERMIAKMETIKDNPLEAMKLGDLEYRREEIENAKRREQRAEMKGLRKLWHSLYSSRKKKEPMETVILEKTIIKLGGLLALGFGEAGAEIIGHNMKTGQSAGVDAMVSGIRVDAIVGFATIYNFLLVNQVLKEKIMIFVNQVCEIVHGCVDDFNGAANKNVGDSFLLIWRITGYDEPGQRKLADMAIMSFVRIITEVNKSPVLAQYRLHPSILQRIPNYRVRMGFGLHCGWAIEGAIGSDFKIDASYLSPNVNVAALLEGATQDYSVWLLVSHFMMNLCSPEVCVLCRLIDHVMVKSARQPMRLFTIDLDYMALEVKVVAHRKLIRNRFKIRQIREIWKQDKWCDDYQVAEAFEMDEDVSTMRQLYSPEFFRRFATAYRNYEAGSWRVARDLFFTCYYEPRKDVGSKPWISEDEWPPDGPTQKLLRFMHEFEYKAPATWPGYRELKEGNKIF